MLPARRRKRTAHGVPADAAPARHQRPGGAARDGRGAARAFRRAALCRQRLRRPGDADRLRPDHQPALRRRLHDRAACRCGPNHRVLEVGTGSGYQAAVLSRLAREVVTIERYRTLADSARARLKTLGYDQCRGAARRRARRRAGARAIRSHHRHGGGRERSAGAGRPAGRGRHHGAAARAARRPAGARQADQDRQGLATIAREDLIAVRFVPLLPGQARELYARLRLANLSDFGVVG